MRRKLALAAALASALALSQSAGHDPARPELDSWFRSLQGTSTGPCCDGSEAAHVEAPDWELREDADASEGTPGPHAHYWVRLQGSWLQVPHEAEVREKNLTGYALVWPYTVRDASGAHIKIRCFLPGSEE
jgi:hypothetical protein